MLYPLSYEGGDAFVLVRALRSPIRRRRTSRSVMVGRGLAAAYPVQNRERSWSQACASAN